MPQYYDKYDIEPLQAELDRLRASNAALLEVLACAKGLLAWKDHPSDKHGYGYLRDTDGSRKQIKLLEQAIAQAEEKQP